MSTHPQPDPSGDSDQPARSLKVASSLARTPEARQKAGTPQPVEQDERSAESESQSAAWLAFGSFNPVWLVNIAAGVACAWQLWEMSNPQHPLGHLIWGDLTTGLPFSQSEGAGIRWGKTVLLAVPVIGCLCVWFSEHISEIEWLQDWSEGGRESPYLQQSPAWLIWGVGWVMLFILPGICTQLVVRVSPPGQRVQSSHWSQSNLWSPLQRASIVGIPLARHDGLMPPVV